MNHNINSGQDLLIGSRHYNRFTDCKISQLMISKSAIYSSNFSPSYIFNTDSNALIHYKFDEGSGTTLIDRSGNGNNGTIVNGATWVSDNPDVDAPTISSVSLAADNSTIAVTMSEAVYNTNGGSGALEVADFALSISGGVATLSSTTPSSISISGNVYTLGISLSGTPNGSETLTVVPTDNGIYDAAGNEASTSQSNNTATLNDKVVPTITGVAVAADNSTIAVTMSEAVYNTNGGSGALEVADFALSISGGVATLSSATPSSISISGNVYTLGISLSGTPNGSETLTVVPTDNGIYDAAGNEASTSQSNNTATLNDKVAPTITGVALAADNATIAVTMSEAVYNTNGGSGALEASDFSLSISGGNATLSSSTPSSISNTGMNVYTLGIGLSSNMVYGNETLTVTPVANSIYDAAGNVAATSQSNNTATLTQQLGSDIDGEAASDQSGYSVSMNSAGDRIAIGAYLNDGTGSDAGHVRIYQ